MRDDLSIVLLFLFAFFPRASFSILLKSSLMWEKTLGGWIWGMEEKKKCGLALHPKALMFFFLGNHVTPE